MSLDNYIASGILELYVLNALEPEEMAEVDALAHQYPAVQVAITRIRDTFASYGELHPETPQPGLRAKVIKAVKQEVIAASETSAVLNRLSQADISVRNARVIIAASISLLLLSMLTALNFYFRWQEAAYLANSIMAEKIQMAAERDLLQAAARDGKELLAVITNTEVRLVNLIGVEAYPKASALVAWNQETTEVFLWVYQLPQPEPDSQYQLWAFVAEQAIDVGVFDVQTGSISMKPLEKAQAFAITLEPKGGSSTPSLEQLLLIGSL